MTTNRFTLRLATLLLSALVASSATTAFAGPTGAAPRARGADGRFLSKKATAAPAAASRPVLKFNAKLSTLASARERDAKGRFTALAKVAPAPGLSKGIVLKYNAKLGELAQSRARDASGRFLKNTVEKQPARLQLRDGKGRFMKNTAWNRLKVKFRGWTGR